MTRSPSESEPKTDVFQAPKEESVVGLDSTDENMKSPSGPSTKAGRKVIVAFEKFENGLWKSSPMLWIGSFFAPFLVTPVVLGAIYLIGGWESVNRIVVAAIVTVFILGRFVILAGQTGGSEVGAAKTAEFLESWGLGSIDFTTMPAYELFFMLTYMDLMVAGFLAFHLGFVFRIPVIGTNLADMIGDGQSLLEDHPWFKRLSFLGLVVFVIFPTSTTGSVGGSVVGQLMGLSRFTTFLAIAIGSVLGNGLMLLLAGPINAYVQDQWWLKVVGIAIVILIFFFLERRYRHMKKVARAEAEAEQAAS